MLPPRHPTTIRLSTALKRRVAAIARELRRNRSPMMSLWIEERVAVEEDRLGIAPPAPKVQAPEAKKEPE